MSLDKVLSHSFLSKMHICDWAYTEELTPRSFKKYTQWVDQEFHGPLNYLADYRKDKRQHLDSILPGTKSALVFLFDYSQAKKFQMEMIYYKAAYC